MTRKSFATLEQKMDPERLERARLKAQEILMEMLLSELRKEMGLTQAQLAENLGIKQPTLSKLESGTDMQISTLRRIITALGGSMEIIAHMPGADIKISQFHD